ncbi:hypothetical protein ANG2_1831, partial [Streptococcus constellatus subsp. constellatus SK53]
TNFNVSSSCFAAFFFVRREMAEWQTKAEPSSVRQVAVLPDTIKVNGDSLSFRGKANGQTYQIYYKLKSKEEQLAFQNLSSLVTLTVAFKLKFSVLIDLIELSIT